MSASETPRHPLLLVFHLSLLFHHLNKEAEKVTGISVVQWCVLKHLIEMPGVSPLDLADAVRVHPSSLTQSLKRLVRKKFIFMTEDPRDSRKKIVSITRKGRDALQQAERDMSLMGQELEPIARRLAMVEEFFQNRLLVDPTSK